MTTFLDLDQVHTADRAGLERLARKLSDMRMFADRIELHDKTLLALLSTAELRALVDGAVAEFKDSLG